MPQTLEALDHAKAAQVPIVVAVNKIDKEEADPNRVRTQMVERGIVPVGVGRRVRVRGRLREGADQPRHAAGDHPGRGRPRGAQGRPHGACAGHRHRGAPGQGPRPRRDGAGAEGHPGAWATRSSAASRTQDPGDARRERQARGAAPDRPSRCRSSGWSARAGRPATTSARWRTSGRPATWRPNASRGCAPPSSSTTRPPTLADLLSQQAALGDPRAQPDREGRRPGLPRRAHGRVPQAPAGGGSREHRPQRGGRHHRARHLARARLARDRDRVQRPARQATPATSPRRSTSTSACTR